MSPPEAATAGAKPEVLLDVAPKEPYYTYIARTVRQRILRSEYSAGDKLPSEEAMCQEFGVSRMTVRHALAELVNAGLIHRVKGVGAFVTSGQLERDLNSITGFYEEFENLGLNPASRVLVSEHRFPSMHEQQKLGITKYQPVRFVRRIRYLSDVPMGVQSLTVPIHVVPDIDEIDLETTSFYRHLRDLGIPLERADQHISAVVDPELAGILGIPGGIPYLQVERTSFVRGNQAAELLVSSFRADKYSYHVSLSGEGG